MGEGGIEKGSQRRALKVEEEYDNHMRPKDLSRCRNQARGVWEVSGSKKKDQYLNQEALQGRWTCTGLVTTMKDQKQIPET